ncbi:MAG: hypothetical protein AABZ39_03005 [Spirochaetota bacterium]
MDIIAACVIAASIIILAAVRILDALMRRRAADRFHARQFAAERIYTVDEVAAAFHLERHQFLSLIKVLEDFDHFRFFNKRGVVFAKDYYSPFELKALVRLVSRKNRLPV